jgi:hypothetical protein
MDILILCLDDAKVSLDEFKTSTDQLVHRPIKSCPERCNRVQAALDKCKFDSDPHFSQHVNRAKFMMMGCRLNTVVTSVWERCILESSCGQLPSCFASSLRYDGEYYSIISNYYPYQVFGFLKKGAKKNGNQTGMETQFEPFNLTQTVETIDTNNQDVNKNIRGTRVKNALAGIAMFLVALILPAAFIAAFATVLGSALLVSGAVLLFALPLTLFILFLSVAPHYSDSKFMAITGPPGEPVSHVS